MSRESYLRTVALKYGEEDGAPRVVAAGRGETARRIAEEASKLGIPAVKDPGLAEQLMHISLGEEIPLQLYAAVAEIYAFLYKLDGKIGEMKDES